MSRSFQFRRPRLREIQARRNIGERGAQLLPAAGHDVATVRDEGLAGVTDDRLFALCAEERRALVTLDHDFGHVLRFPPSRSAGIVVLEVTPRAEADTVLARVRDLVNLLQNRELGPELWIHRAGSVARASVLTVNCQASVWLGRIAVSIVASPAQIPYPMSRLC